MFLIGGVRSKVKARPGPAVQHQCATCDVVTPHRPVTVHDGVHLFFIEVGGHDRGGYQCTACGEVVTDADVHDLVDGDADGAATELEDLGAARQDRRARRALTTARAADGTPGPAAPDAGAAAADVLRAIHGTVAGLPRVDDPGGIRTPRHRPAPVAVDDDRLERELAALKAKRPR